MRILYWTEAFWPYIGGLEVFSVRLLTALRARGHEILVVTAHGNANLPNVDEYRGIAIRRFFFLEALGSRSPSRIVEIQRQVVTLEEAFAPDLVHISMTAVAPTPFFHLGATATQATPLVVTLVAALDSSASRHDTLRGGTLRRAGWVTAVSRATLSGARALVPEITARSSVIYNGLDIPVLPPSALPREAPRLLCVGRLTAEKGFDVALAAVAGVSRRFPGVRLAIAGDGSERRALEQRAAALGLGGQVDFLGWVAPEQMPTLINTASIAVVPSREEAFGIAALEAASMARPVVATRVGGLPEVVVHGRTGLLVERDDPDAMGTAILWLLGHPEAATRMGDAGRRRAMREFTLEGAVAAYVDLYRRLTEEGPHAVAAESLSHQ